MKLRQKEHQSLKEVVQERQIICTVGSNAFKQGDHVRKIHCNCSAVTLSQILIEMPVIFYLPSFITIGLRTGQDLELFTLSCNRIKFCVKLVL